MKYLSLIVMLLLCTSFVVALDEISLKILPEKDTIRPGEAATYGLVVTNNQAIRDVFQISYEPYAIYPLSDSVKKIVIEPNQVKLDPGESAGVNISIRTLPYTQADKNYIVTIGATSLVNQAVSATAQLKFFVVEPQEPITLSVEIPKEIVPGTSEQLVIHILNNFDKQLSNVVVDVDSEFPGIAGSLELTLNPHEEHREDRLLSLPLSSKSRSYTVTIRVHTDNRQLAEQLFVINVPERPFVDEQKNSERGFLITEEVVSQQNKGNIAAEQELQVAIPWFKRFFTSLQPAPNTMKDGVYVWTFLVQPGGSASIRITTNYRPILYGLIILILAVIGLFAFTNRMVIVKKRVMKLRDLPSGVSEMRVVIHIQNGKKFPLTEVNLIDLMPNYVEIPNEFMTLKPDRIQHGAKTIRLFWNIARLEPKEERVISYKVKTKLSLLSGAILPPASLHFLDEKHQLHTVRSERVILGPASSPAAV